MSEKKNKKKIILAVGILVLIAALFIGIYVALSPKASKGAKNITVEIIDDTQKSVVYEVNTDAEYLGDALRETEGLSIEGTEGEYGLMVDTVNGVVADFNENGAYWAFYVDGEYCMYGVDQQPIEDGQEYQIIYTAE